MKSFKDYVKKVEEEVAANNAGSGAVDLNPTGKPKKMDKRSRFSIEKMYKRAKG